MNLTVILMYFNGTRRYGYWWTET